MASLGVLEIFFGPTWSMEARHENASFLASIGFKFYIYGPKADPYLRKRWMDIWPEDYLASIAALSTRYREAGLKFGLAFSPFGTQENFGPAQRRALDEKIKILDGLGLDTLGLFFDDMPGAEGLAERQMDVLHAMRSGTKAKILFCPSYYSDDPILDKVFGPRPAGYLEKIGLLAPTDVEIAWTGPKVLSDEISPEHLERVSETLRRRPFLCDNVFANDGPKNCKFLKMKPLFGRSPASLDRSSGWSFNPMNQERLSRILLESAGRVMLKGEEPVSALRASMGKNCSGTLARILEENSETFLKVGLDQMPEAEKAALGAKLAHLEDPMAAELKNWLEGKFGVGSECLTD